MCVCVYTDTQLISHITKGNILVVSTTQAGQPHKSGNCDWCLA